ncbi:MAG: hypothetical protein NXI04_26015 [Planctomycetaceae bacterium]|nr:hypothetical protein [Planctomycetaceae bacterium]
MREAFATHAGITGNTFAPNGFEGTLNSEYGYSSVSGGFVRSNATGATTADGDDLSDALANDYYWSFTLTNSTGHDCELESLNFDHQLSADGSGATATAHYFRVMTDSHWEISWPLARWRLDRLPSHTVTRPLQC